MTEIHHIFDSEETAEGFLRNLSDKPGRSNRSAPRRTGRRTVIFDERVSRPWLPASASLFLWGTGQWMNGQRSLGLLFMAFEGLAFAAAYFLGRTWEIWTQLGHIFSVDELHLQVAAFFVGAAVPLLGMACILQAHSYASRLAPPCAYSGSAALPFVSSALVPGMGQILNDQIVKAGFFLASWSAGVYVLAVSLCWPEFWAGFDRSGWVLQNPPLSAVTTGALVLVGLAWVVAPYDALVTARKGA